MARALHCNIVIYFAFSGVPAINNVIPYSDSVIILRPSNGNWPEFVCGLQNKTALSQCTRGNNNLQRGTTNKCKCKRKPERRFKIFARISFGSLLIALIKLIEFEKLFILFYLVAIMLCFYGVGILRFYYISAHHSIFFSVFNFERFFGFSMLSVFFASTLVRPTEQQENA